MTENEYRQLTAELTQWRGDDQSDNLNLVELLCQQVEMDRRKELLSKHPYAIYKCKDTGYWATYLPDGEGGRIKKKRKTKTAIQDIVVEYWREEEEDPPLKRVFDDFIKEQEEMDAVKPITRDRMVDTFNRHFSKIADKRIQSFDHWAWVSFLQGELADHKLKARAWGNLRSLFRKFITYCRIQRYVDYYPNDILADVQINRNTFKKDRKTDEEDSYSLEERQKILDYIQGEEKISLHDCGVMLLFLCGFRIGELASLKWEDVEGDVIHVHRTETRSRNENGKVVFSIDDKPKTEAGDRYVPVPDDYMWVLDKIRELNPDGEFLLEQKGKRIRSDYIRCRLHRLCDIIDIPYKSPHKARKTYASILMERGVPDYLVTRVMGHTDIKTTQVFYGRRIGFNSEKTAINQIPELQGHSNKIP